MPTPTVPCVPRKILPCEQLQDVRVTNVDRNTIIKDYRAAPVVNNTVIDNYTKIKQRYNYTNVKVSEKPHNTVINRIQQNETIIHEGGKKKLPCSRSE